MKVMARKTKMALEMARRKKMALEMARRTTKGQRKKMAR